MVMTALAGNRRCLRSSMCRAHVVRRHQTQVEHQKHRDSAERPFHQRNTNTRWSDQAAIFRHVSAQRRQASAHALQSAMSWAPHSLAHQSQISAQRRQSCFANGLCRAIASAQSRQIAAHSTQQAGHALELVLPLMCAKQCPHSVAQSLQAAMQSFDFWSKCSFMMRSFWFLG
jgi:hypothetical protein